MGTKEEVLAGIYQNRVFENFGEVEVEAQPAQIRPRYIPRTSVFLREILFLNVYLLYISLI